MMFARPLLKLSLEGRGQNSSRLAPHGPQAETTARKRVVGGWRESPERSREVM